MPVFVGTNGTNTFNFSGALGQLTVTLVNPYTGESIYIDEEKNINDSTYDGLGGTDTLLLTNFGDALFLENPTGTQILFNIEVILAGDGGDVIVTASTNFAYGNTLIDGGAGDDIIWSNGGNDTLNGRGGNDILDGGPGNDLVRGGDGNDVARGGNGDDTVQGDAGNDFLFGDADNDTLLGGAGNDILSGGSGNDTLDGGADIDTADYSLSPAAVSVNLATGVASDGFGGTDTLVSIENATGSNFGDLLIGSSSDNILLGGLGDDTLEGGAGNDTLDGGAGDNWLSYANGTGGATVDLALGTANDGMGGTDTLSGFEKARGSAFDDTLLGDTDVNTLEGLGGSDALHGFDGEDILDGGDGADFLYGGAGNDEILGGEGDDIIFGGTGGDDSAFVQITTQAHEFSTDVILPQLIERKALNAPQSLGVAAGDLAPGYATSATITYIESGAGYNNTLGHYQVAADGTILGVGIAFANVKDFASGTEKTVAVDADKSLGFFTIADGARENGNYNGIDLNSGTLKFYYKYGTAEQRLAKVTDNGNFVKLVHEDGASVKIKGHVYHTTDRGGSLAINGDNSEHVVSGSFDMTPTRLDAVKADVKKNMSALTKNGITVSVEAPVVPGLNTGALSWVGSDRFGGIGIKSNGSPKIWSPGEVVGVSFAEDASRVFVNVSDICGGEITAGIDFKLYLSGGDPLNPITGEIALGSITVFNGIAGLTFDADDFASGAMIEKIELFSVSNSALGTASFLVNNVQIVAPNDVDSSRLRIGFEDLRGLGDEDYNDLVFDVRFAGQSIETVVVQDNDRIDGGAGNDVIDGGYGNDVLIGNLGDDTLKGGQGADILAGDEGADTLYGGSGIDTFVFRILDGMLDTVQDFTRGAGGDVLNVAELLQGYDPLSDAIADFVRFTSSGADSVLEVSASGNGVFAGVATILGGVGGASAADLLVSGNLVADTSIVV